MRALILLLLLAVPEFRDRERSERAGGRGASKSACYACNCADSTNLAIRSQAFENAVWTKFGGDVTVTASDGTEFYDAPDGTNTAQRLTIAASCAGTEKGMYQLLSTTAAPNTGSVWVKSISGTTSVSLSNGGTVGSSTPCVATTSGWTQCSHTRTTATSTYFSIGCNGNYAGSSNTGPSDVLIWQGQFEEGSTATCPILTTTTPTARTGPCSALCP